jgi:parvulin-like peptidyl-prolyl isomerase
MSQLIAISQAQIIHQIKLSCKMPAIVEDIISRQIIEQTAEELSISVETEELQRSANNFRIKNNLLASKDTLAWLQKHYLSLDEFEEWLYIDILISKLAKHLFADRVEAFYVENQLNYYKAIIYEVVFDNLDLAMELYYALQEKEIFFAEVARQYITDDIELRRCGGYKGILNRDRFKPEIAAAVFSVNPPQVVKPIVAGKQVHLIQVEEIIRPQLDEDLRSQILDRLFDDWLKQKIEEIDVTLL